MAGGKPSHGRGQAIEGGARKIHSQSGVAHQEILHACRASSGPWSVKGRGGEGREAPYDHVR